MRRCVQCGEVNWAPLCLDGRGNTFCRYCGKRQQAGGDVRPAKNHTTLDEGCYLTRPARTFYDEDER